MKYCVAIMSYFENEIKQFVVDADTESRALFMGLTQFDPHADFSELEDMSSDQMYETLYDMDMTASVLKLD